MELDNENEALQINILNNEKEESGRKKEMWKGTCLREMQLQIGGGLCPVFRDRNRNDTVSATAGTGQVNLACD